MGRAWRRAAIVAVAGSLLSGVEPAASSPGEALRARQPTQITIDGRAHGRRFDGVGALSGGGGNARYLIDYPRAQREAILDYLFKPGYGASLQILKVEIGGDANSTDGAEPSVEHERGAIDCNAGYEWWLMEEARARNPRIRLYALAWAAPGWTGRFRSRRTIRYMVDWLRCARRHHLVIDYLGGTQNEGRSNPQYRPAWTKALRKAIDKAGFRSTRLVMSDAFDVHGRWRVAVDLRRDRAFRRATSVVGEHDVCGYPTNGLRCRATRTARRLGLPLWASELGGIDGDAGALGVARAVIRGYRMARLVGYITWPIMSAMPPGVPHHTDGLIAADQPWSGHYRVHAMTYALAMVSWFTAPGWRYVDGANGSLRSRRGPYADGAYTTLRSADRRQWTTIAETTRSPVKKPVRFVVRRLPRRTVRVWRSDLSSSRPANWMVRRPAIHPRSGRFRFTLRPGYVYAFTTVAHRGKRPAGTPPPSAPFGDYEDAPAANPLDDAPVYLAAMDGAFAYRPCWDDRSRRCIQQLAPRRPVYWHQHPGFPYAVIGDQSLSDYTVTADVRFRRRRSSAGLISRFSHQSRSISGFRGYLLHLRADGRWRLWRNTRAHGVVTLAAGRVAGAVVPGVWHHLALQADGDRLTAAVDGQLVASVVDSRPRYRRGIAGIEAGASAALGRFTGSSWPVVQYRHLTISRP